MNRGLSELLKVLTLERVEEDLFRGESRDLGFGSLYGGHVLGQAINAATQTVPSDRQLHSLHAYFLNTGDVVQPLVYQVERLRDGGSMSGRRIVATQGERPILALLASFHSDAQGFEHSDSMPSVPAPDTLTSDFEIWKRYAHRLPDAMSRHMLSEQPIELRTVEFDDLFAPEKGAPDRALWFRATDALPSDPALHRCLLTYVSDVNFISTSLRPHGCSVLDPRVRLTSIDHAMWFHRPCRVDEWLLHVMHSPSATAGRCMVRGSIFSQDGKLVASTGQEGLIRVVKMANKA